MAVTRLSYLPVPPRWFRREFLDKPTHLATMTWALERSVVTKGELNEVVFLHNLALGSWENAAGAAALGIRW